MEKQSGVIAVIMILCRVFAVCDGQSMKTTQHNCNFRGWVFGYPDQFSLRMKTIISAKSPDRLGLLPAHDDELWQLTVVHTVTTDMMGPARDGICTRAGRVCI